MRFNRGIDGEAYLGDTDHRRNEQSLVVDQAGNTFVADSVHDGSSWDFLVAKYGPDGALIWSTRVDSPSVGAGGIGRPLWLWTRSETSS